MNSCGQANLDNALGDIATDKMLF